MEKVEFYVTPDGTIRYNFDGKERRMTSYSEIVPEIIDMVKTRFPACYARLATIYGTRFKNAAAKRKENFDMAARFIRCNFGENDLLRQDIEHDILYFEEVRCPLRGGFCPDENIICKPKGLIRLSPSETSVANMYLEGYTFDVIAEKLGKSPSTIKVQLHSIKKKLGVRNCREIIKVLRMSNI